jgi:hypothetical protein
MMIMTRLSAIALALAVFTPALSADVTIIDIEDRVYKARDLSISKEGDALIVTFTDQNGQKHRMNGQDLVEMSYKGLQTPGKFLPNHVKVAFRNGDVMFGKLDKTQGDTFDLETPLLGKQKIKMAHVARVEFLANKEFVMPPQDQKNYDLIQFSKDRGRFERGTITELSSGAVKYNDENDNQISYTPTDIAAIYFMESEKAPEDPKTLFSIVTLTDETMLRGRIDKIEDAVMHLTTLYGQTHKIPLGSMSSVHFRNGRVVYLSDLTPTLADENANFIRMAQKRPSDLDMPFQRDKSVKGTKLMVRGTEFKKGIGVHARSILEFELGGQFEKFLTQIGIDDVARGRGNVVFEILVDGNRAQDPVTMTGQDEPRSVTISVRGAQKLRLIVHFGEEGNTGDCADWIMARLIRK